MFEVKYPKNRFVGIIKIFENAVLEENLLSKCIFIKREKEFKQYLNYNQVIGAPLVAFHHIFYKYLDRTIYFAEDNFVNFTLCGESHILWTQQCEV